MNMKGKKYKIRMKRLDKTPIEDPSIIIDIRPEREIAMEYRYVGRYDNNNSCKNCSLVSSSDGTLTCDKFMKYTDGKKHISNNKTWKNRICRYHTSK